MLPLSLINARTYFAVDVTGGKGGGSFEWLCCDEDGSGATRDCTEGGGGDALVETENIHCADRLATKDDDLLVQVRSPKVRARAIERGTLHPHVCRDAVLFHSPRRHLQTDLDA